MSEAHERKRSTAALRHVWIGVRRTGLLAALAASLVGCGKAANQAPSPPEVIVAEVLSQQDHRLGRIQRPLPAIDSVEMRPRASGYIDRVHVSRRSAGQEGRTLIVIDPRPYQADFDRASAGLELAKSQRELATLEASACTS